MALVELFGETLTGKDGNVEVANLAEEGKIIGIYFSAHWCPPCRGFTPVLAETYNKFKSKGEKFEVIFVSSDRDEGSFKEYYETMPWLSLPYSDRDRKGKLSEKYGVRGIPTLVLIDGATGETITTDGRGKVTKQGDDFASWRH